MFEEYIKELEEIVEKLESGKIGIEESIKLYKRGSEIANLCNEIIENGKESIKEIKKDNTGISEVPAEFE